MISCFICFLKLTDPRQHVALHDKDSARNSSFFHQALLIVSKSKMKDSISLSSNTQLALSSIYTLRS